MEEDQVIPNDADFIVRGFSRAPERLLLETWHRGEASKNLEASVWERRIVNPDDEAARYEVVDRRPLRGRR